MKLPSLARFWNHVTAERLAVAVFLAVAFGLWWGMQSRPERVITIQTGPGATLEEISPDGTLYLVTEFAAKFDKWDLRGNRRTRLRVFDLKTGQEIWRWERSKADIWEVHWTTKNHLYYMQTTYKHIPIFLMIGPFSCHEDSTEHDIFGIDPRGPQGYVFRHRFLQWGELQLCFAADGNTLAIKQTIGKRRRGRVDLADLRTGEVKPFLQMEDDWPVEEILSPDGSLVLSRKPQQYGSVLLLHDAKTGQLHHQFPCRCAEAWGFCATFSPDGRLLAAPDDIEGFHDRVRVWDVHTGKLLATLDGLRTKLVDPDNASSFSFTGVGDIRFQGGGTILWIRAGKIGTTYYASPAIISDTDQYQHVFDARSFQRLLIVDRVYAPSFSAEARFLSALREWPKNNRVVICDLQASGPGYQPIEIVQDEGLDPVVTLNDLVMMKQKKWSPLEPTWMVQLRKWLGWPTESTIYHDLVFRQIPGGQISDRWLFHTEFLTVTPLPQRQQLLLHFDLGNGQHRLELYSLPPRRPWFHILGWALVAGVSVELLGLWRRVRRKRIVAEDTTTSPVV